MREIDLRADLLPRHHEALRALSLLSGQAPADQWCVVGGLMVLIAARSIGRPIPRAEQTKDADVLVDVCTDPTSLSRVVGALRSLGYETPEDAWNRGDVPVARS